jgi:hypothetical protein
MATQNNDLDERITRIEDRTTRILIGSGLMFGLWQVSFLMLFAPPDGALRRVDLVASLAFVAWSGALLMLLATGGGAFRARAVREVLDDELARSHRAQAYQNAFWVMMLVTLGAYAAAHLVPLDARLLAHGTLSTGVLVAVATVAFLRRR